jgi:DNA-binding protein YbaB
VEGRVVGDGLGVDGAAGDRLAGVLADLRDQLSDFVAVRKELAGLEVSAAVAEGSVEVTVNAHGQVIKTLIDECYLDEYGFDELGGHITEAAQAAAGQAAQRVAKTLAPINERHKGFASFSDLVQGLPDVEDLMPPGFEVFGPAMSSGQVSVSLVDGIGDDGDEGAAGFPRVRR